MFISVFALQLLGAEIGFRLGRRVRNRNDETLRSQVGIVEASILGILGLMLGFAFSMAASRFDSRRQQILEEANAIGTTVLRTSLLPEEKRQRARLLLQEYTDARIAFYDAGTDEAKLRQVSADTEKIQTELWEMATSAGNDEPRSVMVGLFIQTLNELIDLHSTRIAALSNRAPWPIFAMLYLVAMIALGLSGYAAGTGGRRLPFPTIVAAFLITSVIVLIIDLHRPREGLIRVGQKPMLDLHESLNRNNR